MRLSQKVLRHFAGPKSLTLITWPQLSAKEARKHSLSSGWLYAYLKYLFHYYIRGAGSVLGKLPEMAICTPVSQTAPEECLTQPPAMGTQDSSQWETGSKVICLGFDSSAPFLGFLISKTDKITALTSCGDRDEQTMENLCNSKRGLASWVTATIAVAVVRQPWVWISHLFPFRQGLTM